MSPTALVCTRCGGRLEPQSVGKARAPQDQRPGVDVLYCPACNLAHVPHQARSLAEARARRDRA